MARAETRELKFPIMLAAPPVGQDRHLAYDSYDIPASKPTYVSNMIDPVLAIVRVVTDIDASG